MSVHHVFSIAVNDPNQAATGAPALLRWFLASYDGQVRLFLLPFFLGSLLLVALPALVTVSTCLVSTSRAMPTEARTGLRAAVTLGIILLFVLPLWWMIVASLRPMGLPPLFLSDNALAELLEKG